VEKVVQHAIEVVNAIDISLDGWTSKIDKGILDIIGH
jgi:hypothetical protein